MPTTLLTILLLLVVSCGRDEVIAPTDTIGNAAVGRELVRTYGCHTCHEIPTIDDARATVGPPLDRFRLRVYAGSRLNTPENLVEFLVDPRAVDPHSPMPSVGLSERNARHIAAFLFTLQ